MILCIGEALIDMIPAQTEDGAQAFVPHAGGAIFNTAIALSRLGATTSLLSGLSSDMFGQQLISGLEASGVDISHLIISDRPTTLAFVKITNGEAHYSFFDENTAGRMLSIDDMPELSHNISALYCGGISLACEPGAAAYESLITRESAERAVMIDPNIRPSFIKDVAHYRQRVERMMLIADIIKVSEDDLNWIRPGAESSREKVNSILQKTHSIVILTAGSGGAFGYLPDGHEVAITSEKVAVVDTVGAGDTFNAGILAKLNELNYLSKAKLKSLSPDTLETAMRYGAKAAAISVTRAGANPPWEKELE